jgi:hypothetical protein
MPFMINASWEMIDLAAPNWRDGLSQLRANTWTQVLTVFSMEKWEETLEMAKSEDIIKFRDAFLDFIDSFYRKDLTIDQITWYLRSIYHWKEVSGNVSSWIIHKIFQLEAMIWNYTDEDGKKMTWNHMRYNKNAIRLWVEIEVPPPRK